MSFFDEPIDYEENGRGNPIWGICAILCFVIAMCAMMLLPLIEGGFI